MQENYFKNLLDPKGVKVEFLLEFLSDLIYGELGKKVTLLIALDDFNLSSKLNTNVSSSGLTNQNYTLGFRKGTVIKLVHTNPNTQQSHNDSSAAISVNTSISDAGASAEENKDSDKGGNRDSVENSVQVWTGVIIADKKGEDVEIRGTFPSNVVRVLKAKEWSCKDVVEYIIKPLTKQDHSIFCKTLHAKQKINNGVTTDNVVAANTEKSKKLKHFVVNSSHSNFYTLVQAIANHFKGKDISKEYVWLDVVCLNQHVYQKMLHTSNTSKSVLSSFLVEKLKNLINLFDGTLVFFDKFDVPSCLSELFSLWKIYLSLNLNKKVEAVLTKSEKILAFKKLSQDYVATVNRLPRISIQNILGDLYLGSPGDLKIFTILRNEISSSVGWDKEINDLVTSNFLKVYLGQLSIAMWHERKHAAVLDNNEIDFKQFNEHNEEYYGHNALLEMATLSNKIGLQVYNDLKWIDLAKVLFFFSAKTYVKALGKHHPFVATAMQNLSLVSYELGNVDKSINYIKKSIETGKKNQDKNSLGDNLNLLAGLFRDINKSELAEKIYHEMLVEYKEEFNNKDSIFMAVGFNNLAEFLKSTNRPEEAEVLYKEALRVLRTVSKNATTKNGNKELGNESLHVMCQVYNNLGTLYESVNKQDLALDSYSKGLTLLRKTKTDDDLLVDQALNNVATFLFVNKRFNEAEDLIRNSIKIRVNNFGKEHNAVAQGLENLAVLLRNMNSKKKQDNAIKPLIKACEIFTQTLGEKHPRTIKCQEMIKASVMEE